jgi:deazaflavin-dependent oxidoreductase (nitroreductase family)
VPEPPSFEQWTRSLRGESTVLNVDTLDPVERDATDNAVGFSAEHARRYIATQGRDDGWEGPRPILLLYTTGKVSGTRRRNPVLYIDIADSRFIVASRGGDRRHPAWYFNLLAEPTVHVRLGAQFYEATAITIPDSERVEVWPAIVARYPMFEDYQAHINRTIPVVRLTPSQPESLRDKASSATG